MSTSSEFTPDSDKLGDQTSPMTRGPETFYDEPCEPGCGHEHHEVDNGEAVFVCIECGETLDWPDMSDEDSVCVDCNPDRE